MKPHHTLALIATAAMLSLACASTKKAWDGSYTPSSLHYLLYSNDLDEAQPPTRSDQLLPRMLSATGLVSHRTASSTD